MDIMNLFNYMCWLKVLLRSKTTQKCLMSHCIENVLQHVKKWLRNLWVAGQNAVSKLLKDLLKAFSTQDQVSPTAKTSDQRGMSTDPLHQEVSCQTHCSRNYVIASHTF